MPSYENGVLMSERGKRESQLEGIFLFVLIARLMGEAHITKDRSRRQKHTNLLNISLCDTKKQGILCIFMLSF
jgi:hypothetical protein